MKRSFTIIEALVVVCIIALMISTGIVLVSGSTKQREEPFNKASDRFNIITEQKPSSLYLDRIFLLEDSITKRQYLLVTNGRSICITPLLPENK